MVCRLPLGLKGMAAGRAHSECNIPARFRDRRIPGSNRRAAARTLRRVEPALRRELGGAGVLVGCQQTKQVTHFGANLPPPFQRHMPTLAEKFGAFEKEDRLAIAEAFPIKPFCAI